MRPRGSRRALGAYGWVTLRVAETAMQNLDVQFFYELGRRIGALESSLTNPAKAYARVAEQAAESLRQVAKSSSLPIAKESALALSAMIEKAWDDLMPWEKPEPPNPEHAEALGATIREFRTVFPLQLKRLHAYLVTEHGLTNPEALIERPEEAFDADDWRQLPKVAQLDWRSACQCFAFDLSTTSGFHALRALEAVATDYIARLGLQRSAGRNLHAYLELLRSNGAKPERIDAAQKMRELYRNPLMHPDATLTLHEAGELLHLCKMMIRALLDDMREHNLS